jgi:hypothetical protein
MQSNQPDANQMQRTAGNQSAAEVTPLDEQTRGRAAPVRRAVEPRRFEHHVDRDPILFRAGQVVDYLFLLLYGLLGIRFVLTLLGASDAAGFVRFINSLTEPFYGPFAGIVERPEIGGGLLDLPLIIALLAYALLHAALKGLMRVLSRVEGPRVSS